MQRLEHVLRRVKAGTGAPIDFSGTWKNELGSTMRIEQSGDSVSGTYEKSAVSENGGATSGQLSGYVDGDLIAFVVHWDQFQAITAWVGQGGPGASSDRINTLWQMTQQVEAGEEWASINAGADIFVKT